MRISRPSLAVLAPPRWLRLPARTVRLRLTVLYSALFLASGAALLTITYVLVRRASRPDLVVAGANPGGHGGPATLREALANPEVERYVRQAAEQQYARVLHQHTEDLHQLLVRSGIALAMMTVVSLALGWLVAGRVLRPLRAMTATTRHISASNLDARLALPGPGDELRDLADTIDGLLGRLEAHVAEQQRFAANASHELRTPLAAMQTLLEVARTDPHGQAGELVVSLHALNTRAIALTEALLMLSRADQRAFTRERVDLSLVAEEATEALIPLAERRGVTIESAGEMSPTLGSHALLLQLSANLTHNAIVHNLSTGGSVWVATSAHRDTVVLTVENTGERLAPRLVSKLAEPFVRGSERVRSDHAAVGLGLAIAKSITQAHDGTLTLAPREGGGLRVKVELPVAPRVAGDPLPAEQGVAGGAGRQPGRSVPAPAQ